MSTILTFVRALCLLTAGLLVGGTALAQSAPGWAWAKAYGGPTAGTNEESQAGPIGLDAAGNVYVLGSFVGGTAFDARTYVQSLGEDDVFLAKYTPAGALLWVRVLAGSGQDKAGTLVVTATGDCFITGQYGDLNGADLLLPDGSTLQGPRAYGMPNGGASAYDSFPFAARFDTQGNMRWAMRFAPSHQVYMGLQVDSQGNLYFSGSMPDDLTLGGQSYPAQGPRDAFIIKMTPARQVSWVRRLGGAGEYFYGGVTLDRADNLYWAVATSSGNAFVVDGHAFTPLWPTQLVYVKLSSQNQFRWGHESFVTWAGQYASNSYSITGFDKATDTFIFETSHGPNHTATFRGSNLSLTTTLPGASYITGRIDTSGNVTSATIWASSTTGDQNIGAQAIRTDAQGVMTIFGQTLDDFTPVGASRLATGNRGDLFVTRYDPATHTSLWTRTAPLNRPYQSAYNEIGGILDAQGNAYVAGRFVNPAQFGPVALQPSRPGYRSDGFLAKLDMTVLTATTIAAPGKTWTVYPNPATGAVQLGGLPPRATVQVLDGLGRVVREARLEPDPLPILSLTGLAAGLYTLRVAGTAGTYRPQRLVVE